MAGRRRFEQFLSILFLAAGTALLLYGGLTWFAAQRKPPAIGRVHLAESPPQELPPALVPFSERPPGETITGQQRAAEAAPAAGRSGETLLPQSPLSTGEAVSAGEAISTGEAGAGDQPPDGGAAGAANPQRILIPSLGIDAPIVAVGRELITADSRDTWQWAVPDSYAAGWHEDSALPGQPGNMVLNGHNNVHGAIFGELAHLPVGEQIVVIGGDKTIVYRVTHHELLAENSLSLRERLHNARWIEPGADERLTLVTCWPNTTNSHRLIVVARPLEDAGGTE